MTAGKTDGLTQARKRFLPPSRPLELRSHGKRADHTENSLGVRETGAPDANHLHARRVAGRVISCGKTRSSRRSTGYAKSSTRSTALMSKQSSRNFGSVKRRWVAGWSGQKNEPNQRQNRTGTALPTLLGPHPPGRPRQLSLIGRGRNRIQHRRLCTEGEWHLAACQETVPATW